jgi:hypothetical protein
VSAGVPDVDALHARLATLERRTGRVTLCAGAAGVLAVLAAALAGVVSRQASTARPSQSLEGRQIALRDSAGKLRALLGVRADGSVALMLSDAAATPRIMMGVGVGPESTPVLALSDNQGRLRAALAVAADGAASVGFLDGSEMVRTTLGTAGNGAPALNLVDDARHVRAALQEDTDGTSLLRLFDRAGQPRVALGLNDDAPSLVMRDENGALLGKLPDQ